MRTPGVILAMGLLSTAFLAVGAEGASQCGGVNAGGAYVMTCEYETEGEACGTGYCSSWTYDEWTAVAGYSSAGGYVAAGGGTFNDEFCTWSTTTYCGWYDGAWAGAAAVTFVPFVGPVSASEAGYLIFYKVAGSSGPSCGTYLYTYGAYSTGQTLTSGCDTTYPPLP